MVLIKKYGNRRLYDTAASHYLSLDELADKIRGGMEVQVVDARSGLDLTQLTLGQIIFENQRASRLLPAALLVQLIRIGEDGLSEFFGRYLAVALDLYLQARQGAQTMAPYYPLATLPFAAGSAFARLFAGGGGGLGAGFGGGAGGGQWGEVGMPQGSAGVGQAQGGANGGKANDVAELRREVEELKQALRKRKRHY